MEKFRPEISFQLRNLTADCRLLNAVRHPARSGCYPAMPNDVIKKFEMMDVNSTIINQIDVTANNYRLTQ